MDIEIIDQNMLFYITLALFVIVIVLGIWIWKLEKRINKLLGGRKANLENVILESHKKVRELENFRELVKQKIEKVDRKLKKSLRAVETVKFNPFKGTGTGGNQSFSSAFISEEGDGVVLSGLYLRDRISLFAKPLKSFNSELELSEEEKDSVRKAKEKVEQN